MRPVGRRKQYDTCRCFMISRRHAYWQCQAVLAGLTSCHTRQHTRKSTHVANTGTRVCRRHGMPPTCYQPSWYTQKHCGGLDSHRCCSHIASNTCHLLLKGFICALRYKKHTCTNTHKQGSRQYNLRCTPAPHWWPPAQPVTLKL